MGNHATPSVIGATMIELEILLPHLLGQLDQASAQGNAAQIIQSCTRLKESFPQLRMLPVEERATLQNRCLQALQSAERALAGREPQAVRPMQVASGRHSYAQSARGGR